MYSTNASETKIMKDLVKELIEFNNYMKHGLVPFGQNYMQGNYFLAFNPSSRAEKELYTRNIRLIRTIFDVLDENCINITSQGYTFMKDAICIIIDKQMLDVCFIKEIYPYIADKYGIKGISTVEHSIRNAINAAYKAVRNKHPERSCIMNSFDRKPTNKKFLLRAVQEVSDRLLKELSE